MDPTNTRRLTPVSRLPTRFRPPPLPTSRAEATSRSLRFGTRLVDRETAPSELVSIQLRCGLLGIFGRRHFYKREAPWPAGRHIAHDVNRLHRPHTGKELLKLDFARFIGEISNIQSPTHDDLLRRPLATGQPGAMIGPPPELMRSVASVGFHPRRFSHVSEGSESGRLDRLSNAGQSVTG